MKFKTRKTVAKRVRVTRTGKIIKRAAGQDHFNSRESGKVTRNKRRDRVMSEAYARNIKQLI